MKNHLLYLILLLATLTTTAPSADAQEMVTGPTEHISDSVFNRMQGHSYPEGCREPRGDLRYLHLPALDSYGQMPTSINRWSAGSFTGYCDWALHPGLNLSLGASVFAGLGSHAPSGAGFAQSTSGMYALPLTSQLSLAFGGYFVHASWGSYNQRDAGLNAVLGYRFNEQWEGYLYGRKSLTKPRLGWPFYGSHELGDRIGAAIRHNFSPSFSVQLNVECGTSRYEFYAP